VLRACRQEGDIEQAELVAKVQARLCNPLLRQPAPWE
jgi:hypothetical protein